MNNKDILQKAIEKAVENGWDNKGMFDHEDFDYEYDDSFGGMVWAWWKGREMGEPADHKIPPETIFFSHDFAKAFWKEPTEVLIEKAAGHEVYGIADWEYHLKQLAVAEDRLAYLEQFI